MTVQDSIFDKLEDIRVEMSIALKVSKQTFLEHLRSGLPIRTFSKKLDGTMMKRTLIYDGFRNGIAEGKIYDYLAKGYQVMESISDGGPDNYRTIVIDKVDRYLYLNQLYVIKK